MSQLGLHRCLYSDIMWHCFKLKPLVSKSNSFCQNFSTANPRSRVILTLLVRLKPQLALAFMSHMSLEWKLTHLVFGELCSDQSFDAPTGFVDVNVANHKPSYSGNKFSMSSRTLLDLIVGDPSLLCCFLIIQQFLATDGRNSSFKFQLSRLPACYTGLNDLQVHLGSSCTTRLTKSTVSLQWKQVIKTCVT